MSLFSGIKGMGFDLDGTLVNSLPGLAQAVDATLESLGLPTAGDERVSHWIGNGASVLITRALTWAGGDTSAEYVERARILFDHHYGESVEQGTQLYPHVESTLKFLADDGIKMALVTNKPTQFVRPLLNSLGILDYFSVIIGGDDVVEKKPHPAPIYLMLGQLGLRADELVFVGDSRNDIQAGQAAGCPTIGLSYGYNYGESITLSHPDRVLATFAELLPVIGQLTSKMN
ncbi:phosphoglycolate phosphatase [Pragia fontium]|uniref:Phosphoglycolate phosphatase n=2 Tax=Pragia fontium TaxID=82985 RepID=A0AAJ4WCP8_9GAMM|nr:phosphoglycolate phosphatase [Pragia fontium]AKJ40905.1 phosphoglycolate phosphatase [Pragia fontium]GKX64583.1 phosphoglycolate phosphatase [Pragia fontium]SFD25106.1 phosphoglycolate phosphatase [Pragia fontium DSM 5563 = ATCC 49100]VEJ53037.1 Phosphoglycolate phosphatase [Pragia fontium]